MDGSPDDVFITDLPRRVVGGLRPARGKGEGWVELTWECDGKSGTGLATGALSGAPELIIDLGIEGEWVLYAGLAAYSGLRMWLDGEKGYRQFNVHHGGPRLQECRFHRADLTGRRLHVAPVPGPRSQGLGLTYLRARREDHAPKKSARNVVGTNDGWSYLALDGCETAADVYRMFTPLRDSDVSRLLYGPGGADFTSYHPTKIGTCAPHEPTHAFRECDVIHARAVKRLRETGVDPLAVAAGACRDVGVELHFYIRPEAFFGAFPWDGLFDSRFFLDNPQWRCRDEFGDQVMRMSYAHKGVQDHMLAYIEELMRYDPAGISIAFNRSLPVMICEEPVLEAYEARHGRRPALPTECDSPEMLRVRQDLLTNGFLARLHAMLSARGKALSFIVDGDGEHNAKLGLDLKDVIGRGWLQAVYNTGPCHGSAFWREIAASGKTEVYPTGHNWDAAHDHANMARAARDNILDAGFAGPLLWDIESCFENPYNWHVVRHLGSRAFLNDMIDGRVAPPPLPRTTRLNGVKTDRYNPNASY
ncbi:MAG: hypothetical protein K8S99_02580 [Planctomycetes bacterium]|nr:hypothetical protein [Planctomycetota bacterium]